jgi:hypothetical protein
MLQSPSDSARPEAVDELDLGRGTREVNPRLPLARFPTVVSVGLHQGRQMLMWFESTTAHHVFDLKFATEHCVAPCAALARVAAR